MMKRLTLDTQPSTLNCPKRTAVSPLAAALDQSFPAKIGGDGVRLVYRLAAKLRRNGCGVILSNSDALLARPMVGPRGPWSNGADLIERSANGVILCCGTHWALSQWGVSLLQDLLSAPRKGPSSGAGPVKRSASTPMQRCRAHRALRQSSLPPGNGPSGGPPVVPSSGEGPVERTLGHTFLGGMVDCGSDQRYLLRCFGRYAFGIWALPRRSGLLFSELTGGGGQKEESEPWAPASWRAVLIVWTTVLTPQILFRSA